MCDCVNGTVPEEEGSDALGFENELWASANTMRGNMDAAEYKHVVLPLVFLKYISDSSEDLHANLVSRGRNPELEMNTLQRESSGFLKRLDGVILFNKQQILPLESSLTMQWRLLNVTIPN